MMENLSELRRKLMEKIAYCDNESVLKNIENLLNTQNPTVVSDGGTPYNSFSKNYFEEETVKLSDIHLEMIKLAEEDIKAGRVIDNEELKKLDEEWMKW